MTGSERDKWDERIGWGTKEANDDWMSECGMNDKQVLTHNLEGKQQEIINNCEWGD